MQETWVWSLGREDPLEKEMATHASILAWKNPMDRGVWQTTVHGVPKSWAWLSNWECRHACKRNQSLRQKVDFSEWSEQMDYTQNFKFIEDTHLQVTKSGFQNKTLKKPREVSIQAHNSCSRPYVVTETCKRTPPQKWTRFKWSLYTKSLF